MDHRTGLIHVYALQFRQNMLLWNGLVDQTDRRHAGYIIPKSWQNSGLFACMFVCFRDLSPDLASRSPGDKTQWRCFSLKVSSSSPEQGKLHMLWFRQVSNGPGESFVSGCCLFRFKACQISLKFIHERIVSVRQFAIAPFCACAQ